MLEISSGTNPLSNVKIVCRQDPALDMDDTKWDEYESGLDANKLVVKDGKDPTFFICNFALPANQAAKIKNAMISGTDDDNKPKVGLGDWGHTCTQYVLKHVENGPASFVLKRDGNKKLMPRIMDQLHDWGMIDQIFNHYLRMTSGDEVRSEAKN